jgi:hypothetical protein
MENYLLHRISLDHWQAAFPTLGYHDVAFLNRTAANRLYPDRPVTLWTYGFMKAIERVAGTSFTHGTVSVRIFEADAIGAGDLHVDSGNGQRFVLADSTDGMAVANEFFPYGPHGASVVPANGVIIQYGNLLHRRRSMDGAPGARRIFASASLYRAEQEPDLTCHALQGLTTT